MCCQTASCDRRWAGVDVLRLALEFRIAWMYAGSCVPNRLGVLVSACRVVVMRLCCSILRLLQQHGLRGFEDLQLVIQNSKAMTEERVTVADAQMFATGCSV